nr:uncharacterized protein LOC127318466 isoform X2 [Lolium perenne]
MVACSRSAGTRSKARPLSGTSPCRKTHQLRRPSPKIRVGGEIRQLPWTPDEVHPIDDSSIFLRPEQTLGVVRDVLSAMPRLCD